MVGVPPVSKKKHRKIAPGAKSTPLREHKREGSRLRTPLSQLGMVKTISWERDLLPEHLWLGALAEDFGVDSLPGPYNAMLDAVDEFWTADSVCLGLLSDFALINPDNRTNLLKKHGELVRQAFCEPFGRILAFYPECPAAWLVGPRWVEQGGHLDPEVELGRLRHIVSRLLPGKDEYVARIRAIPLNRLFKHNKIKLAADLPVVDLLPRYPVGLSPEELYRVESLARSAITMVVDQRSDLMDRAWPKHFWRHNYDLVPCRPIPVQPGGEAVLDPTVIERITRCLRNNSNLAKAHLDLAARSVTPDLYEPTRNEVFSGLFSRLTRLYCLLCEDPSLWARDTAGIMLRCLADSAIVFSYLVKRATDEEIRRFVEYGEGQQKLLMLHLQDNYPQERSLEGQTSEELLEQSGRFAPELLDIELSDWTPKDRRRLAREAGLEHHYRLIFGPASGEVHGSWLSVKRINLVHCAEVLHRFHRLPSYVEPPLFVDVVDTATQLFLECVELAENELGFPSMGQRLDLLRSVLPASAQEGQGGPPASDPVG